MSFLGTELGPVDRVPVKRRLKEEMSSDAYLLAIIAMILNRWMDKTHTFSTTPARLSAMAREGRRGKNVKEEGVRTAVPPHVSRNPTCETRSHGCSNAESSSKGERNIQEDSCK